MKKADLHRAQLNGVDLSGSDLGEANLKKANLIDAIVSQEQLEKAKTLEGAKLPRRS